MTLINCGVKLKSEKESEEFIRERFEQLKLDGRLSSPEGKWIILQIKRFDEKD